MRTNDLKKAPLSNGIHHAANLTNIPHQTGWYPQINPAQVGNVSRLSFEANDSTNNTIQQPLPQEHHGDNYAIRGQIDWLEWLSMMTSIQEFEERKNLISHSDIINSSLFQFQFTGIDQKRADFVQLWSNAALRMLCTPLGSLLYEELYIPNGKIIGIIPSVSNCNFGFSSDMNNLLMPYNIDSKLNDRTPNQEDMSAAILFHELLHAWHKRKARRVTPEMLYQIFISGHFLNTVSAYYGPSGDKILTIANIYNIGGSSKEAAKFEGIHWMYYMIDYIASNLSKLNIISNFSWDEVTIEEIMTVNPQSLTQRTYDYLCNLRGIDASLRILNENAIRQELGLPLRESYTQKSNAISNTQG